MVESESAQLLVLTLGKRQAKGQSEAEQEQGDVVVRSCWAHLHRAQVLGSSPPLPRFPWGWYMLGESA